MWKDDLGLVSTVRVVSAKKDLSLVPWRLCYYYNCIR